MRAVDHRRGDPRELAEEYLRCYRDHQLGFEAKPLDPHRLLGEDILVVHYADGGAQGDAGAVELLRHTDRGPEVLYGNYAFGDLDLDAVIRVLPMLEALDSRNSMNPPYPFGGKLDVPQGWKYFYMGAMNHYFIRDYVGVKSLAFLQEMLNNGGGSWQLFQATAWFFQAR